MPLLRLSDGESVLELGIEETASQTPGDARLTVKVHSAGFGGHGSLWVDAEGLRNFCSGLVTLEHSLRGEACLASLSPNKLDLKLLPVNALGQLAVSGSIGRHIHDRNDMFWHAVTFGFEFELSQLSAAVRLPWVQRYAAQD